MPTAAAAGLDFRIGGDATGFRQAMQEAQRLHQQATQQMSQAFQRATAQAQGVLETFTRTVQAAGAAIGASIQRTLEATGSGWRGVIEGAFNSVNNVVHEGAQNILAVFTGGGILGAMATAAYALFRDPINKAIDEAKQHFAEAMLEIAKGSKDSNWAADIMGRLNDFAGRTGFGLGLGGINDWINQQFGWTPERIASEMQGGSQGAPQGLIDELQRGARGQLFNDVTDAMQKQTEQTKLLAEEMERTLALQKQFGLDSPMVAAGLAQTRSEAALLTAMYGSLSEAQKEMIANGATLVSVLSASQREVFERVQRTLKETAERYAAATKAAADYRREVSLGESRAKASERIDADMQRELQRQQAAIGRLTMAPGDAESRRFYDEQMLRYERAGVVPSQQQIDALEKAADKAGALAEALAGVKRQMDTIQQYGSAFSSALSTAFTSWLNGTELKWKDFFHKLATQIATIALQTSILQPLFGGGGIGTSQSLFGGLFTPSATAITPMLASGGPATAGMPHIVGEDGPELFVPRQSGTVLPNSALRGGSTTFNMSIDLKGANGDETIARIARTYAAIGARQAIAASRANQVNWQQSARMLNA